MNDKNKEKKDQTPVLGDNNRKTKVLGFLLLGVLLLFTFYILFVKVQDIISDAYETNKKFDAEYEFINSPSQEQEIE